jgi:hypothetical protein
MLLSLDKNIYCKFFRIFRNKIGRIDKTPSRTPDSILLPAGGNGRLYGLVAVKDSCPNDGKEKSTKLEINRIFDF